MEAQDIFKEVLKSKDFEEVFKIPRCELDVMTYEQPSNYPAIEIVRSIIKGITENRSKEAIYTNIQNKIMKLQ